MYGYKVYLAALVACSSLMNAVQAGFIKHESHGQQLLQDSNHKIYLKVRHELKRAEIIPTVLDDFLPSLTISAKWSKESTTLGNTVQPEKLQDEPTIHLSKDASSMISDDCKSNLTYVITLTDPDAPSHNNPEWSEISHWIATGVLASSDVSTECMFGIQGLDDLMPYKAPGPPPKTGKHRYVFVLFAPSNGTTEELHLSKPKDRKHWGYEKERHGVRDWAAENGLTPVSANFLYSQNKKQ